MQIHLRERPPTPIQAGRSILWGSLEGLHHRAGGLTRVEGLIAAHFVCKPCHRFLLSPRYRIDSARLMRCASQPPAGGTELARSTGAQAREVTAGQ